MHIPSELIQQMQVTTTLKQLHGLLGKDPWRGDYLKRRKVCFLYPYAYLRLSEPEGQNLKLRLAISPILHPLKRVATSSN